MASTSGRLGEKCPSLVSLIRLSMALNVLFLLVLLPVTFLVYRHLTMLSHHCPDAAPGTTYDDMKASYVTQPHDGEETAVDVSRYCFKEEPTACREKGRSVKTGEDGDSLCCGHLGSHLFSMVTEALADKLRADSFKGQSLQKVRRYMAQLHQDSQTATFRPAAHVGILQNANPLEPEGETSLVQWDDSGEESFLTGGILHRGDRLVVTRPGFYYVYSSLQFNVDPATQQSEAIVGYLFRTVNGTRESRRKLMTSRESSCRWTRGDDHAAGPVSMHMAGIFLLKRDDEISVITSSHGLLNRAATTTYLGMHMV